MYRNATVHSDYIESEQLPLLEDSRSISKIDYIVKIGLGKDQSKLNMYRRVIANPKQGVQNQVLRQYTSEVLEILLDIVFSDSTLWNRVKTLLIRKNQNKPTGLREAISEDGLRAIMKKSMEHEVPLSILFEVYSRGCVSGVSFGTPEQAGFSRVNSFLAGGAARRQDADLLGETVVQEAKVEDKTLGVLKRVLREQKEKRRV